MEEVAGSSPVARSAKPLHLRRADMPFLFYVDESGSPQLQDRALREQPFLWRIEQP
jgi:hypothetical protein